jgi:uncharacterized membrane protein YphA (DoxX/SURF4 family)
VLAAICFIDIFKRRHTLLMIVMYVACWACIFGLASRAGLLAALVCNLVALFVVFRRSDVSMNRKGLLVSLFPIALAIMTFAIPYTKSGARLLATLDPTATSARIAHGALGTTGARWQSWHALWQYCTESTSRFLVGVGFGPNFMSKSGALQLLVGHMDTATSPRSPHDYLLGSLARLGLVGVALLVAMFIVALSTTKKLIAPLYDEHLELYASLLIVGLLLIALLGVVLESPFGAVPFFWSYGVLCRRRPKHRSAKVGHLAGGTAWCGYMEGGNVGSVRAEAN